MVGMQSLGEVNPAANMAWLLGGAVMVLLGIALLLEAVDWIRHRLWLRRHRDDLPDEGEDAGWRLEEPETPVRKRHFRRPFARWYWQRSDTPNASNIRIERSTHIGGEGSNPGD